MKKTEINRSLIDKAVEIARQAHHGQEDKNGVPYILHPMRVMDRGRNDDERVAGVLHDVIEDSSITASDLLAKGIPPHIVEAVELLTHTEDMTYDEYVERLAANPISSAVKINDLLDNMDLRRLSHIGEEEAARLNKYIKAYQRLTS